MTYTQSFHETYLPKRAKKALVGSGVEEDKGELGKMPEHHFSISFGDARGIINAPKVPVAPTKTHEKISNLGTSFTQIPKNYSNKYTLLLFCFRQTEGRRVLSPMRISPEEEEEEDATCCFPYTRNEFFLDL